MVLPYNSSPSVSTTFSTYALKAKHLVVVWQVSLFSPCREDILAPFHYHETKWDFWYFQLVSVPMTTSKWKSLIFVTTLSTYLMNESLNCTLDRHSGHTTAHNTMFLLWCGDVLPKVYIFVQRFVSGTGRGFGTAPQQKHTRCGAWPLDNLDYE